MPATISMRVRDNTAATNVALQQCFATLRAGESALASAVERLRVRLDAHAVKLHEQGLISYAERHLLPKGHQR
jgi:hypothetical protein